VQGKGKASGHIGNGNDDERGICNESVHLQSFRFNRWRTSSLVVMKLVSNAQTENMMTSGNRRAGRY
jgi:hypothetical protein